LGAVERLDLRFLIDTQHHGALGWRQIEADDVTFSTNSGSVESLKASLRCGCKQKAFQMRWTVDGAWPTAAPIKRSDQCVVAGGIVSKVRRIVSAISAVIA